jgi:hypothetical protein
MAYIWTEYKKKLVRELFKEGHPRRVIKQKLGVHVRVLDHLLSRMRITRQPLSNEKFEAIERDFKNRKLGERNDQSGD